MALEKRSAARLGVSVSVEIISCETGQVELTLPVSEEFAASGRSKLAVQLLDLTGLWQLHFLAPERLFMSTLGQQPCSLVWDTKTGKVVNRYDVGDRLSLGDPGVRPMAFSADAKYLVYEPQSAKSLLVVSLETGKAVARLVIPEEVTKASGFTKVEGVCFSTDGNEIAGICGFNPPHLICWNAQAQIVYDQVLPAGSGDSSGDTSEYLLQSLPDGSGWVLNGRAIFDRKHRVLVYRAAGVYGYGRGTQFRLIDEDHILLRDSLSKGADLVVVRVPWLTIRTALAALEKGEHVALRPGQAVSVAVDIGAVDFTTAQQASDELRKEIVERLEADGMQVAENQPIVLHARYFEEKGGTLKVVQQNSAKEIIATGKSAVETGQTVGETVGTLEISYGRIGAAQPFWHYAVHQGSTHVSMGPGPISDTSVRSDMFHFVIFQLKSQPIPTFVSEDPTVPTLPIMRKF